MRRPILILIVFFALTALVFFMLQNKAVFDNTLGRITGNWSNTDGVITLLQKPYSDVNKENYIRWDGYYYYVISEVGYQVRSAELNHIFAFFPFFPLLWYLSHLPPEGIVFLNYLFFAIGVLILLKSCGESVGASDPVKLLLILGLPTTVVFFMPYTEATFLITASIGIYGLLRGKYGLYFIGFFLLALTRPTYTFLVIAIVATDFVFFLGHGNFKRSLKSIFFKALPLLVGTFVVFFAQSLFETGSFTKFFEVQSHWDHKLRLPHNIHDWSHEGFSMNLGVLFFIAIPFLVFIVNLLVKSFRRTGAAIEETPHNYLQLLSLIYLFGTFLFILLFRNGGLNSLSRYVLCSPFLIFLLIYSFRYFQAILLDFRSSFYAILFITGVSMLGLIPYSTNWDFADLGYFILSGVLLLWLFQDFWQRTLYKILLAFTLFLNVVWTTYLFNMYLADGWIFT